MSSVGQILSILLWLYWLVFLGRLIFDLVRVFARGWKPHGVLLVLAEIIYTLTDPPLKLLRRVIPPLRIGSVQFDLAFLIILIGLQILMVVASRI